MTTVRNCCRSFGRPRVMDEPALLVHWERTVGLVLDRTGRFPRSARHTFAARIDARALDVLEQLAVARFAKGERRLNLLQRADADLAVLRVLVRLAHTRQLLPTVHWRSSP